MAAFRNVEIKARCADPGAIRKKLRRAKAKYVGLDRQRDTYFRASKGRLKLREGTIENSLIAYRRADQAGPKLSNVSLYRSQDAAELRNVLLAGLPVDIVVEKSRHIYFLDNVKIHVDAVPPLGHFVEVEVIDADGSMDLAALRDQCGRTMDLLGVRPEHLISRSYSDLLRARRSLPNWVH